MSRVNATRAAWRPQTRQEREAVLLALQEVLASPHFCNSKRYPALLQYIVENTLAGKSDHLKERTLGVEVFDRSPSYDTNADTVVRYTAGEVRKRLSLYYHELGRKPRIQISLPAGSYVPEFLHSYDEPEDTGDEARTPGTHIPDSNVFDPFGETKESSLSPTTLAAATSSPVPKSQVISSAPLRRVRATSKRRLWLALAAMLAIVTIAGLGWRYRTGHRQTALDGFWGPVLLEQHMVSICTGSVVFAQNNFSGVITAGKDIAYPFVSIQTASSIARVSGLLERDGATTQLQFSASTPLTDLREHPVVMLGGYNNTWTLRLLQPLRFHFSPEPVESIVDQTQPQVHWSRDHSLPYSSADDYALVARFRDATTDSWVVVLAGLGRNGTEGATQFVTSPHYMQLLRDRMGRDFANQNFEVVLRVNVIDGKTAAPLILSVYVW